jgi:hypothetical protein
VCRGGIGFGARNLCQKDASFFEGELGELINLLPATLAVVDPVISNDGFCARRSSEGTEPFVVLE